MGMNSMYWTSSGSRKHADHYIAMLYDETSDNAPPGPMRRRIGTRLAERAGGMASQTCGSAESALWVRTGTDGAKRAETISFADAMSRASYSGGSG